MVWNDAREEWEAARPYFADTLALICMAVMVFVLALVFSAITP